MENDRIAKRLYVGEYAGSRSVGRLNVIGSRSVGRPNVIGSRSVGRPNVIGSCSVGRPNVIGSRSVGRPNVIGIFSVSRLWKRWIDTVKDCLKNRGLDVRQARRMVHDRSYGGCL